MNRYTKTFTRLKKEKAIAFIPFAVAGDPDIAKSETVLRTYVSAGADILEIGYPFSDPIADGPVNQAAGIRAIAAGLDHAKFFALISRLRADFPDTPIGLLCYVNTVVHIGFDAFFKKAHKAGIDSILIADLPPEESSRYYAAAQKHAIDTVHIITELTPPERIEAICKQITGFVYIVSRLGPTGVNADMSTSVKKTLARVRKHTNKPLCVGFGLSKPEHITAVKKAGADGAIVGSALVKIIETHADSAAKLTSALRTAVKKYKTATLRDVQ